VPFGLSAGLLLEVGSDDVEVFATLLQFNPKLCDFHLEQCIEFVFLLDFFGEIFVDALEFRDEFLLRCSDGGYFFVYCSDCLGSGFYGLLLSGVGLEGIDEEKL
jgi:hypothetical protein